MSMEFQKAKERAKKALLAEVKTRYAKGNKQIANVHLWCDFCLNFNLKRWDVKIVTDKKFVKFIHENNRKMLENNETFFACQDCIDKNKIDPSQSIASATFEGQAEALKILYEGENNNAK